MSSPSRSRTCASQQQPKNSRLVPIWERYVFHQIPGMFDIIIASIQIFLIPSLLLVIWISHPTTCFLFNLLCLTKNLTLLFIAFVFAVASRGVIPFIDFHVFVFLCKSLIHSLFVAGTVWDPYDMPRLPYFWHETWLESNSMNIRIRDCVAFFGKSLVVVTLILVVCLSV